MPPAIMTPAQARLRYDKDAALCHISYACYRQELEQVINAANLQATDTVLDLGAGPGWAAQMAAPKCAFTFGLDISPNMVQRATNEFQEFNQKNNTDHLARFAVANMQDIHSIRAAFARILGELGLDARLGQAGVSVSSPDALRFSVVMMTKSFSHIDPSLQPAFLRIVREHLLAESGRLVIAHELSRCDMYAIQQHWLFYANGTGYLQQGYYGRSRLAGKATEQAARKEIQDLVVNAGFIMMRSEVMNKHEKYGFKDLTAKVREIAQRESGQTVPGFELLEPARMVLYNQLSQDFERALDRPREGGIFNGYQVHDLSHRTRHSVATAIAICRAA